MTTPTQFPPLPMEAYETKFLNAENTPIHYSDATAIKTKAIGEKFLIDLAKDQLVKHLLQNEGMNTEDEIEWTVVGQGDDLKITAETKDKKYSFDKTKITPMGPQFQNAFRVVQKLWDDTLGELDALPEGEETEAPASSGSSSAGGVKGKSHTLTPEAAQARRIRVWDETQAIIVEEMYSVGKQCIALDREEATTSHHLNHYKKQNSEQIELQDHRPQNAVDNTHVQVLKVDAIDQATKLGLIPENRVALLNPANNHTPGGFKGAPALEEQIVMRSTLLPELQKEQENGKKYPLEDDNQLILTKDVTLFRASEANGYELLAKPATVGILSSAAVNCNGTNLDKETIKKIMRNKIYLQLDAARQEKYNVLVLVPFGCGVFGNDPEMVAALYKEVIDTYFKGIFNEIFFTTPDPRHFKIFNQVFPRDGVAVDEHDLPIPPTTPPNGTTPPTSERDDTTDEALAARLAALVRS